MLFVCNPNILHKHCLQFLLGVKEVPRETEDNAYAKFWGGKQRALWYVRVFLEWSIVFSIDLLIQTPDLNEVFWMAYNILIPHCFNSVKRSVGG